MCGIGRICRKSGCLSIHWAPLARPCPCLPFPSLLSLLRSLPCLPVILPCSLHVALVADYVSKDDPQTRIGAILGLGIAYAGRCATSAQQEKQSGSVASLAAGLAGALLLLLLSLPPTDCPFISVVLPSLFSVPCAAGRRRMWPSCCCRW
jgi:hypothetical protein